MTAQDAGAERWIMRDRPRPETSVRLMCLPYAGGSAAMYLSWSRFLPQTIEVVALQPPGRGRRLKEIPFTQMEPLAESAARAARSLMDQPYALFGHSLGALTAFALAQELCSAGFPPCHLFVSGSRAPQMVAAGPPVHTLPEPQFIAEIQRLKGTPLEILQNQELMRAMVPALRADFKLYESYVASPGPPLPCPITVFGGLEDDTAGPEDLEAWRSWTTAGFMVHLLPGDHFFATRSPAGMLRLITSALEASAPHDDGSPGR